MVTAQTSQDSRAPYLGTVVMPLWLTSIVDRLVEDVMIQIISLLVKTLDMRGNSLCHKLKRLKN